MTKQEQHSFLRKSIGSGLLGVPSGFPSISSKPGLTSASVTSSAYWVRVWPWWGSRTQSCPPWLRPPGMCSQAGSQHQAQATQGSTPSPHVLLFGTNRKEPGCSSPPTENFRVGPSSGNDNRGLSFLTNSGEQCENRAPGQHEQNGVFSSYS